MNLFGFPLKTGTNWHHLPRCRQVSGTAPHPVSCTSNTWPGSRHPYHGTGVLPWSREGGTAARCQDCTRPREGLKVLPPAAASHVAKPAATCHVRLEQQLNHQIGQRMTWKIGTTNCTPPSRFSPRQASFGFSPFSCAWQALSNNSEEVSSSIGSADDMPTG